MGGIRSESDKKAGRGGQRGAGAMPEVEAAAVIVHVLGLRRMELHHALIRVPEQVFDPAHLRPRRAFAGAVWQADADVLPALCHGLFCARGNDGQSAAFSLAAGNEEGTKGRAAGRAG